MIKVTDFVNYYTSNFQAFFEDTDMLEYEEDILRHILYNMLELVNTSPIWDIKECIAINVKQYFQDSYIESNEIDPDTAEADSYDFIYQYDIVENLDIILKEHIKNFTESNDIKVVWSEDVGIDFLKENNEIYLVFTNNEIVKYTDSFDLHNSKKLSTKGFNKFIDLSNELIIYNSLITKDNGDGMFFQLVEYYLSLKERTLEKFYKEYLDIIPVNINGDINDYNVISKENLTLFFNILNKVRINTINFNGWIRNTTKIRSTNV